MSAPPARAHHGTRTVARKLALQALYRWQLNACPWQELLQEFGEAEDMVRADREYFRALIEGVWRTRLELDTQLASLADREPRLLDPIGHRALAVNLSDLAAMGARPAWALLALTLPDADEGWLAQFAAGFGALARAHEVALVGGDTTRGPLCVTVQLLGHVPRGEALRRCGGRAGDALFVSGTPGDAAAGLALEQGRLHASPEALVYLRERFLRPTPRIALGERLRRHASACIDVSDGLLGDA